MCKGRFGKKEARRSFSAFGLAVLASSLAFVRVMTRGIIGVASIVARARSITFDLVSRQVLRNKKDGLNQNLATEASSALRVCGALALLVISPHIVWMGRIPAHDVASYLKQINVTWDSIMHMSMWPVVVACSVFGLWNTHTGLQFLEKDCNWRKYYSLVFVIICFFLPVFHSQLQVITPSRIWNPFLLFQDFSVYYPHHLAPAMEGMCLDQDNLCLSQHSWQILSAGALDSRNPMDVAAVNRGIRYARETSGGLIVNIMARDTVDAIPALRLNVEALKPFFTNKLSVVVFENDSKDGTREAFKEWGAQAEGYAVDVMSCGEKNPDCQFGLSHRYDSTEAVNYFNSSAIGKMANFRQKIVDYVTNDEKYAQYSHMLVMDLDLQVSLSPLGIMHTFGKVTDAAAASSGRQTWPGSLGTLIPPYDFSAFRALKTPDNERLLRLHHAFCAIMPPGDRWRNQCDAVSIMHSILVLRADRMHGGEPYEVESAFNGATLYPLDLIKRTNAKYDIGDDGQRCEHIGFNMDLKRSMYVNPKWNFHVAPNRPGGPTGPRAFRNVMRIVFLPQIALSIGLPTLFFMFIFMFSVMTLVRHLLYPLLFGALKTPSLLSYPAVILPLKNTNCVMSPDKDGSPKSSYKHFFRYPSSVTDEHKKTDEKPSEGCICV